MAIPHAPDGLPEITEVQVKLQDSKALRAFVSITFANCFVVRGLKIIQGMHRRFVAMPGRKRRDETFQDIAHPITRDYRDYLETRVLEAYESEVGRESPRPGLGRAGNGNGNGESPVESHQVTAEATVS